MRSNRNAPAKKQKNLILIIAAVVLVVALIAIYFGCTNNQDDVQTTSIRTIDVEPSHLDLLFRNHGEVSFNYVGRQVSVYVAHYEYYELVLHELIAQLEFASVEEFSGNMIWGITTSGDSLGELRVRINAKDSMGGAASHQRSFNFTPFDIEAGMIVNDEILSEPLERGERHVFHARTTGTQWNMDSDWFDANVLGEYSETVLIYIVFD